MSAPVLPFDINGSSSSESNTGPRAMLPSTTALGMDAGFVQDVQSYVAALHMTLGDTPNRPPEPSNMVAAKALGVAVPQAYSFANLSFMPDAANYGLMQWPGINPESLSKICRENIGPRLIIEQRVADMEQYAGVSAKPWEPGWHIELREASETPARKDLQDIKDATSFIFNGSRDYGYQDARERDSRLLTPFHMFLRQFASDIHTYDGWAIWTQPDRLGRPIAFANLPAGLIRLAMPGRGIRGDTKLFAALIDQTMNPVKMFTRNELVWSVMNPRTDPAAMGYGFPSPEQAMRLIQALQSAIDLNASVFDKNGIPNGMLLLKGDYWQQEQIDALQREWTNMKRGVSKMWGMPIMGVPEDSDVVLLDFMDLKGQEVRYKDHMNMMVGFYAIICQFPIARLGLFASGGQRDNKPAQNEATDIQGIDDPGLPAHLLFIENRINSYLVWPTWPHLKFVFMNKNPKQDARAYQERTKTRTWGEARAQLDMQPLAKIAPAHLKPLAEIMDLAPMDPALGGIFQTVATQMLEAQLGVGDNKDQKKVGAPFPSLQDPAITESHGYHAGVRRKASEKSGEKSNG
jgi:hypothetical protein